MCAKDLFCIYLKKSWCIIAIKKKIVPTQPSILFQWQSKAVDPVDPFLPSFLYSFYYLYVIELVLILSIAEILLAGR